MLQTVIFAVVSFIVGAILSFFVTRNRIQKHIKENPPISAKQIRAMYISMGRKPSEAQVNKTLKSMGIKNTAPGEGGSVAKAPMKKSTGPIGNKKKKKSKKR